MCFIHYPTERATAAGGFFYFYSLMSCIPPSMDHLGDLETFYWGEYFIGLSKALHIDCVPCSINFPTWLGVLKIAPVNCSIYVEPQQVLIK